MQYDNSTNQAGATEPAEPRKRPAWFAPTMAATVALIVGGATASFGASTEVKEVEVEVPVVEEVEVVKEVEVTKEAVPEACVIALDEGEDLIELNYILLDVIIDFSDATPAALEAAMNWDTAGIDAYADEIDALTARFDEVNAVIDNSTFAFNRDSCLEHASK